MGGAIIAPGAEHIRGRRAAIYTSERGVGGDPGTGHVWTARIE